MNQENKPDHISLNTLNIIDDKVNIFEIPAKEILEISVFIHNKIEGRLPYINCVLDRLPTNGKIRIMVKKH